MKKIIIVYILMILALCSCISYAATTATTDSGYSKLIVTSLVNQNPDPASAGDVVEVMVSVENKGDVDVNNLVLEFIPSYPFSEIDDESYVNEVGTLNAYQSGDYMKIVKFKVRIDKDTTAGNYDLKINVYEKGSTDLTEKSIPISVKNAASAEVIQIDKTILIPGKETSLAFKVTNVGSGPIKDLTFSWLNSDKVILPVGSDNTKYIKYLDVGQSVDLDYEVIADSGATAGLYQLSLTLSYTDPINSSSKSISTIAGVYVGGGTDFDVAFSESSSGTTSFTIANIGSNPASSVSIIIPKQNGWQVTGANSVIIGNLNTGDYTVSSFTLSQASSAIVAPVPNQENQTRNFNRTNMQSQTNNQNNLRMQIAYTDTMGTREIVEKNVTMNQQSSRSNSTGVYTSVSGTRGSFGTRQQTSFFTEYKWYILSFVVIVLLVGLILFRAKYKREKLLNPDIRIIDIFKKKETGKRK